MTIKELEARTGMVRANIRYYEEEGLLAPRRLDNGYRDYSEEDVRTLEKIKLLRSLQLDIDTIRQLQRGKLTSGETIVTQLTEDGLLGPHEDGYRYEMTFLEDGTPQGGQSASVVTVPFSNYKTGVFRYDAASGLYRVEEYGEPYIDGNDNSQVAITNLLILRTACTVVDDAGRLDVDLSQGEGWYACGGQIIPITWSKGAAQNQLRYFTQDGQPLSLGAGKSYVCIIPTSREITAE